MNITSLGYQTDLMLLRLRGSSLTEMDDYIVVRTPSNPTFWWGHFLLFRTAFAPGELPVRLKQFASEFPDAKHVAFGIDSVDGVVGAEEELSEAGFEVGRDTVMTASEVREPSRPNTSSEFRCLTSPNDWEQQVNLTLATAPPTTEEGYEGYVRAKIEGERRLTEAGQAQWFGAFEAGKLQSSLGLVTDGAGVARFQSVQTHPGDRGRGLASTLVHRASTYGLSELRARTLVMVADPGYLAIGLYRALGFADRETQIHLTKRPQ
ncbi:GNAT family N-acetyltransferase [Kribbella turkmenica]|uniref:GNAT family N-acetyltransferase n=1 Tax=Kribbella turkmenica TaxID=2530375 RepID=A0A4R4XEU1_9ACTN|nr:GNAT family N-acetyltransferase [Kribbella turkmenica]TDD29194.1 GNAT family N-acetyltransferase [Kribbella turkmenica]